MDGGNSPRQTLLGNNDVAANIQSQATSRKSDHFIIEMPPIGYLFQEKQKPHFRLYSNRNRVKDSTLLIPICLKNLDSKESGVVHFSGNDPYISPGCSKNLDWNNAVRYSFAKQYFIDKRYNINFSNIIERNTLIDRINTIKNNTFNLSEKFQQIDKAEKLGLCLYSNIEALDYHKFYNLKNIIEKSEDADMQQIASGIILQSTFLGVIFGMISGSSFGVRWGNMIPLALGCIAKMVICAVLKLMDIAGCFKDRSKVKYDIEKTLDGVALASFAIGLGRALTDNWIMYFFVMLFFMNGYDVYKHLDFTHVASIKNFAKENYSYYYDLARNSMTGLFPKCICNTLKNAFLQLLSFFASFFGFNELFGYIKKSVLIAEEGSVALWILGAIVIVVSQLVYSINKRNYNENTLLGIDMLYVEPSMQITEMKQLLDIFNNDNDIRSASYGNVIFLAEKK